MGSQQSHLSLCTVSNCSKKAYFKMSNVWKNGMFSCFNDPGPCLCVSFCYPCAVYRDAEALNKSGLLCCLFSCIFPCIPAFFLRNEAREKYDIEGSVESDAMGAIFCTSCVQCQIGSEINNH